MELLSTVRRTLAAGPWGPRGGALAVLAACLLGACLGAALPAAGIAAPRPASASGARTATTLAGVSSAQSELAKLLARVERVSAHHHRVPARTYRRIHVLARRVGSRQHPPADRCKAALRRALGLEKERARMARLVTDSRSARKNLSACAVKPAEPPQTPAPAPQVHNPVLPSEAGAHLWAGPTPPIPPPIVNPEPPHGLKPPAAVLEGYEAESHSSGKTTFGEDLPVVGDVRRTSKATPTSVTEYATCTRQEKSSECLIALKAPITWNLVEGINTEPPSEACHPTENKLSGQESNAVVGLLDLSYGAGGELLGGELVPVGAPIFSIGEAPLRGLPIGTDCGYWKMTEAQEKEAPKAEPKLLEAALLESGKPIEEALQESGQVTVETGPFSYQFTGHIRVRFIPGTPGAPIPGTTGAVGT